MPVRQGLKDVGYIYVNIDDGFFGGRDEQGQMTYHRERFPQRDESCIGLYSISSD